MTYETKFCAGAALLRDGDHHERGVVLVPGDRRGGATADLCHMMGSEHGDSDGLGKGDCRGWAFEAGGGEGVDAGGGEGVDAGGGEGVDARGGGRGALMAGALAFGATLAAVAAAELTAVNLASPQRPAWNLDSGGVGGGRGKGFSRAS